MGKPAAVLGSYHVCPKVNPGPTPHVGGPVAMGSPNVLVGGIPAAREGDKLICVGPPDTISSCSSNVLINGKKAACLGDGTAHGGRIVAGNMTVYFGSDSGGFSVVSPTALGSFNSVMRDAPPNHEMRCGNATYKTDSTGNIAGAGGDTAALQSIPTAHPYKEPGRIYGGNTLPCGGRDSTNSTVFKDPATQHLDEEAWRKPVVKGNKVDPFEGSRTPAAPIAIKNYKDRNKIVTKTGRDGNNYTVSRDEHGFPKLTIFETHLPDKHIGTGKKSAHFKAANKRMKALLTERPELARHMGLTDEQVEFFTQERVPGTNPPELTWHHHQDVGKIQLVGKFMHDAHRHTGGMSIWGGGY